MSKEKKGKDNKREPADDLEKEYSKAKMELLEKEMQAKQLESTNAHLAKQLHEEREAYTRSVDKFTIDNQKLNISIETLKKRLAAANAKCGEIEMEKEISEGRNERLRREQQDAFKEREKEFEQYRKHSLMEITRLECQELEWIVAIRERDGLVQERKVLMKLIDEERELRKRQQADQERDKIQVVDSLKNDMHSKFRDMKTDLLQIRKQQLDNNTRLTLLQNNQLLDELEYQSSKTESILTKNVQLEKEVKRLNTELSIQREIESQLCKRSSVCKKVLKSINLKNEGLTRQLALQQEISKQKPNQSKAITDALRNEELVAAYHRITLLEKQLAALQAEPIKAPVENVKQKQLGMLLNRFYSQILDGKALVCKEFNFMRLKESSAEHLSREELAIIVKAMITAVQGPLQKKHLDVEYLKVGLMNKVSKENQEESKQRHSRAVRSRNITMEEKLARRLSNSTHNDKPPSLMEHTSSMCKLVIGNIGHWGKQPKKDIFSKFINTNKCCTK